MHTHLHTSEGHTPTTSSGTASPTRRRRLRAAAAATVAGVALSALVSPASAGAASAGSSSGDRAPRPQPIEVLQTGLNSPKGVDSFLGVPIVSQGAFGPPAPVLASLPGWFGPTTKALSSPIGLVDVAVANDLSLWGLGADHTLYRKTAASNEFRPVADLGAYQVGDPDPANTEGEATESNPYGLAVLPNGNALVTDAANNDLLRITPRGQITTVARFGTELVSTDHLPPSAEQPLPPMLPAEAVPTSVVVTPDGVLVSELKGFPFRPGTSRIWKVDPNATDAVCSVTPPATARGARPACAPYASGFTAVQDLAYEPFSKQLFVYQLAADGVLAFEGGMSSGQTPPAVLTAVSRTGQRRELAAGQLSQPGGIEVDLFGRLFATDGVFGDGRLVQVRT